jgi:uncharacterized membrane protein SpoIIM required for sporulation
LAYARAQRATPGLVDYLNGLVGNAHGVLYAEDQEEHGWSRLVAFITRGFPNVMRRRMPFVAAAFLLTLAGYFLGYFLCVSNPGNVSLFIPDQFKSSMDAWKQGFADHGDISIGQGVQFSSMLMTHNTEVGIAAFATGITLVAPLYLMASNGWIMGALVAVVGPTGKLGSFWPGILPHGVCELSAIFICGGAGLLVGWAIINPGEYSRRDALVRNGKDAAKLMLGTVPLFIIAGIIEGNVSHSSLPHWAKYTLAAVQFIALVMYIYGAPIKRELARRNPAIAPTTGPTPSELLHRSTER